MKRLIGCFTVICFCSTGYAGALPPPVPETVLDQVGFQVSAKQWVNTQSALLMVTVNATLDNADLVKARADIMAKLNQVAAGEWHLTQFDRSQDSSGLEKLSVQAQARVNQSSLTDIYKQAKAVSKPGATYEISAVEFKPSLDEEQQARVLLREKLYQQVRDEISRLNKIYTGQNYSVNQLVIVDGDQPIAQPRLSRANAMLETMALSSPAPLIAVSHELVMTAFVQAASNRKSSN